MRIPTHPGRHLKEELAARELSGRRFAELIGVPQNRVTDIIRERRGVTAVTALRLEAALGIDAQFWLNLQQNHDLGKAKAEHGKVIRQTVSAAPTLFAEAGD